MENFQFSVLSKFIHVALLQSIFEHAKLRPGGVQLQGIPNLSQQPFSSTFSSSVPINSLNYRHDKTIKCFVWSSESWKYHRHDARTKKKTKFVWLLWHTFRVAVRILISNLSWKHDLIAFDSNSKQLRSLAPRSVKRLKEIVKTAIK